MASLSNDKEAEIIQAFNSSKYLHNISYIENPYFEGMLNGIYPPEQS